MRLMMSKVLLQWRMRSGIKTKMVPTDRVRLEVSLLKEIVQ